MGCRWGRTDRGSRVAGAEGKVNDPFYTSVSSYMSEILHNYIFKNFFIMLLSILKT